MITKKTTTETKRNLMQKVISRLGHIYKVRFKRTYLLKFHSLPTIDLKDVAKENAQIVSPILDDICMPPYHGKKHDDYSPLMKILASKDPKVVLELGTAHGNTVANICRQCPQAAIYTVNAPVEMQTGDGVTYKLTRDEIGRVYRSHNFADQVTQIFQNTLQLDLSEYFDGPAVDFAIVDACHDTEYVINDFMKVVPFMKSGGIILLHDTHPSLEEHLVGSYTACANLRMNGFDVKHIRSSWWGIWTKP